MLLKRIIPTSRLILRPPRLDDAESIFERYTTDPEVSRYMTWRPHESVDTTRDFVYFCMRQWESGTARPWVITEREVGEAIGMIEARPNGHRVELGYVLARPFWGKGMMSEAGMAVVGELMAQRDVQRIWAVCDVDNPASARVMEKLGMSYEGILRRWIIHPNIGDDARDCLSYAKVREA
jgi:[ribosomal protein S5]-alanine N-acetyltransferase